MSTVVDRPRAGEVHVWLADLAALALPAGALPAIDVRSFRPDSISRGAAMPLLRRLAKGLP